MQSHTSHSIYFCQSIYNFLNPLCPPVFGNFFLIVAIFCEVVWVASLFGKAWQSCLQYFDWRRVLLLSHADFCWYVCLMSIFLIFSRSGIQCRKKLVFNSRMLKECKKWPDDEIYEKFCWLYWVFQVRTASNPQIFSHCTSRKRLFQKHVTFL